MARSQTIAFRKDGEPTVEHTYVYERRNSKQLFCCNHLSGYCAKKMEDLHYVRGNENFDFLKYLPPFIFSEHIAIEVNNTIEEQLEFKKYIAKLLSETH